MNLDHVEAVKERIAEIRQRFVDPVERSQSSGCTATAPAGFESALRRARAPGTSSCPEELEPLVARAAEKYGIDPAVIKAIMYVESGFRQDAVSRVGAQGLMQLMPGTARVLGVDPLNPAQNIDGGARYLRQQIDRFGSLELAIAAYNAGPGSVIRHGGVPPYSETQNYVANVLRSIAAFANER